jgi:PIN domain nuclease of toxin-antitoxin system
MLGAPERLSDTVRSLLASMDNSVYLSPVSIFEISIKVRIGKLTEPGTLLSQVALTLARLNLELLPVSGEAAALAGRLSFEHRDPFDRLLAAQALDSQIPLMSSDSVFSRLPQLNVVW